MGVVVYCFSKTYRTHLKENLKKADYTLNLRWECAKNAGKQVLEVFFFWRENFQKNLGCTVEVVGEEILKEAQANPFGILFITPHLGAFELTAQWYAQMAEITVLYRAPKQKWLDEVILKNRARENLHLATADKIGVKKLLKALKNGKAIGILPDQTPKTGEGVWVNFFHAPAYTMTLAAKLTQSKASVVYVVAKRLPQSKGFQLCFFRPQVPFEGDIPARAQLINNDLERLIRTCPEQYLWGYNRYKKP